MAKAGDKASTLRWVTLAKALVLLIKFYGARHLAEQILMEALAAGRVRWRCLDPDADQQFWKILSGKAGPGWRMFPLVNWEENWAEYHAQGRHVVYCVEVALVDVERLRVQRSPHWVWLRAELKRMRVAGEAPNTMRIGTLSGELARRLEKAIVQGKVEGEALKPRAIENRLRDWRLWPPEPGE